MTEQQTTKKELISLGENSHWYIYRDDPYKIMYKTASGEAAWVRYASNVFAKSNFTQEEIDKLKTLRSIYDLDKGKATPTELLPEIIELIPAIGEIINPTPHTPETPKKMEEPSAIEKLRAEVINLMKEKRILPTDLGHAPLDQLTIEELKEIIAKAGPPKTENTQSIMSRSGSHSSSLKQQNNEDQYTTIVKGKWEKSQIDLIRKMTANDATDDEFKVFLYVAYTSGLDPLKKQIWCWKQNGDLIIMTSIHGKSSKAFESGQFDGYETQEILDKDGKLYAYEAIGWRKDMGHPMKARAYLAEYQKYKRDGTLTEMWNNRPRLMLEKCAISLLLSRMFPDKLGGLYSPEEFGNTDTSSGPIIDAENTNIKEK